MLDTRNLEGNELDKQVLIALGFVHFNGPWWVNGSETLSDQEFHPSTRWDQAGPIIERERINVGPYVKPEDGFRAYRWTEGGGTDMSTWRGGPAPLIAAMRCFVASAASRRAAAAPTTRPVGAAPFDPT